MTREEAIDLLDNLIGMISDNQDSDYDEALKVAISALSEQESRKEKMEKLYLEESLKEDLENLIKENERLTNALSENKGEWILDETDNSVECNKCGCQIYPNDISYGDAHFCPNCGADMRGGE